MRPYYGWIVVAASLVILTVVLGATFHSFGVFVTPVSEDLKLSRAETNTGLILYSVGSAIWAPIVGKMLDRIPVRQVMLVCAVTMGGSLAVLGLSHSVLLSAIVLALPLAIAGQGAGSIAATTLVARWFSVYRGRAMAIALLGTSLAGMLVTPAIAFCVEHSGWRETLIGVGGSLTFVLLLMVAIVREKPGSHDIECDKPQAAASGNVSAAAAYAKPFTALALLRMPRFWMLGLPCALTLGVSQAVMVTFVPLAEGLGVGPTKASSLIAVMSTAGLIGGGFVAWLADRIDRMILISLMFGIIAVIGAMLFVSHSFSAFVVCAALLGFSAGIVSPTFHVLIADRFGPVSFGTAYGLMTVLMNVAGAASLRYAGEVFDRTGSYDVLFLSIVVVEFVACAAIFAMRVLEKRSSAAMPDDPMSALVQD